MIYLKPHTIKGIRSGAGWGGRLGQELWFKNAETGGAETDKTIFEAVSSPDFGFWILDFGFWI